MRKRETADSTEGDPAGSGELLHDQASRSESLAIGVILRRQRSNHPWADDSWRALGVLVGAAPLNPRTAWVTLEEDEDRADYHAGTLELSLYRKDTEAYKVNLTQDPPRVFVVLRAGDDLDSDLDGDLGDDPHCDHDYLPVKVTVSPYEAQDYLDSGDDLVEPVPMPAGLVAYLQSYVDTHHVDEPFYKRKRKSYDPRKERFAQAKGPAATADVSPPRGPRDRKG
tara:strand:- start:612 stop:1286 length:675 start_codon:yes stop_codon:yes gene_type:complete